MRKLGVAGAAVLAVAVAALADSHVRIVHFSRLSHEVEVGSGEEWRAAKLNEPLLDGETIRTGKNGSAEVELECGSFLRLTPRTVLTASELRRTDAGVPVSIFTLAAGTVYAALQKGDTHRMQLGLPGGIAMVPEGRAEVRAEVQRGGETAVELLDGKAAVQTSLRTLELTKHRALGFGPGTGIAELSPALHDAWWRWNRKRDDKVHRQVVYLSHTAACWN